jgi:hypothetical protein
MGTNLLHLYDINLAIRVSVDVFVIGSPVQQVAELLEGQRHSDHGWH